MLLFKLFDCGVWEHISLNVVRLSDTHMMLFDDLHSHVCCHNVTVVNASESRGFFVEHQQSLQTNTDLVEWANGYHLALSNQDNKTELFLTHIMEHDLDLVLCSLVTTTGVINTTVLVVSGTQQLGDTTLKDYFNPRNFYEVKDANDTSYGYDPRDTIGHDITVVITDLCGSFVEQKCLETGGVCKWNKNGACARDFVDEKSDVGVIVGASVGGAVVLIAVVIVIVAVVLAKKKKKQEKTKEELMNTAMFKTL